MTKARSTAQLQLIPDAARCEVHVPQRRAASAKPARKRAKGTHVRAAPRPWLGVVLAVDTAATSGWCLSVSGRRVDSGECNTLDEAKIERIVQWAVDLAVVGGLPATLVLEAPFGGPAWLVASLGGAAERWLRAWRFCDHQPCCAGVVRILPSQWRGPVLGKQYARAPRRDVRQREQLVAALLVRERPVGADEAPAILIARWAAQSMHVGKAIGKRWRDASIACWRMAR